MFSSEKAKVIDCTIRDGGLINSWQFSKDFVRATFNALHLAGVDYMEIGYRASEKMFPPTQYGPWRASKDDVIREIIADTKTNMKLGAMVDIGRVEPEDLLPKNESPLSFVRVATYLKDIAKAVELANFISGKGYESFINIMAISTVDTFDLLEGLKLVENETEVTAVTVVDSNGALYPDNVEHLVSVFKKELKTRKVGFHAHNNQQLAFANSIQAIRCGVEFCDATVYGIGRGAGNCPLELLFSWLKNPQYNLEPVLQVIQDHYVELSREIEWGYILPYMITGVLNEHPRVAISLRNSDRKDHYADFYRELTTPECFIKKAKQ